MRPPTCSDSNAPALKADQKEQEDDAELGEAGNVLRVHHRHPIEPRGVLHERAEAERTEYGSGAEVAEHRDHAEAPHERYHDAGGAQHDQRIAVGIQAYEVRRHLPPLVAGSLQTH